jgi:ribosome-associated protein
MADDTSIRISPTVTIPLAELAFRVSRSGGPGGQHVNKTSTRVELWWNPGSSPSLTPEQRALVLARLRPRLTEEGLLRIVASETRSQSRNKAEAVERFQELVARALVMPKRRKPTKPTRAARERRLAEKRKRGEQKRRRRAPPVED